LQGLTWSFVELTSHFVQIGLRVHRQVGALREVLSQQTIGVLVRPAAWVAADIVRIEDGKLAEHWDVPQDEATKAQSVSGLPMFGDRFPD
jgi:predicted SnoaL-like aldol condensation-catalyzing enzyme